MSNPLASPTSWDLGAKDYAEVTAPFFENYARVALDRAGVGPGTRVLDIATGPGTLSLAAARRGCQVTAVDFAPSMLDELNALAASSGLRVESRIADGQALPFSTASYDAAFSMFGLIFFPDRHKGFEEMLRVLAPGGVGAITSWQPMERFPLLRDVFKAIRTLLPNLPFGGGKASLGEPADILSEMSGAGFTAVVVEEVSASVETASLDEAWTFLRRGSAPFALLERTLGDSAWRALERGILADLRSQYGTGPQRLTMTANLGLGRRPA
jgi:ubiquinone/menaquinone biosynthesis C-methylase UbiE